MAETQLFIGPVWMVNLWDRLKMRACLHSNRRGSVTRSVAGGVTGSRERGENAEC